MMIQILLFVVSGVLIGLSLGLIFFRLATKKQLKRTKLKAMADMYHELLLKRRNNKYRYSYFALTAIAFGVGYMLTLVAGRLQYILFTLVLVLMSGARESGQEWGVVVVSNIGIEQV